MKKLTVNSPGISLEEPGNPRSAVLLDGTVLTAYVTQQSAKGQDIHALSISDGPRHFVVRRNHLPLLYVGGVNR